jgi:peptide/nickel transport system permease protein
MGKFLLKRFLQTLIVMVSVALIAFSMFQFIGDPVHNMVGEQTSAEERDKLRQELGLDDSIVIQFGRFIINAAHGDFGVSYRNRQPVLDLILDRLPATLELSFCASLIAILLGIPLGVYSAIRRQGFVARAIQTISLIGISLPTFVTGIVLILVFSVQLNILPAFGRGEVVHFGWWSSGFFTASGLKALILPSITLAMFQLTLIMRLVRSEMLEVLRTDYIKFARARGIPRRRVNFSHALKNTLVPVITIIGLQIGSIISFAIVTETIFQWPGMGNLFIQAVAFADIPVMASYLLLVAAIFVAINFVVDVLYFAVDPRFRAGRPT